MPLTRRELLRTVPLACGLPLAAAPLRSGFDRARPVWAEGRSREMNLTLAFRAVFEAAPGRELTLRATGSSIYRARLNGEFAAYGPARGPHGFARVDEWDLSGLVREGRNELVIEVAGYNVNSYYLLDQPAFLQAEVLEDGRVLAATGAAEGFTAAVVRERLQRVQRYSFQRPFSEVYRVPAAPVEAKLEVVPGLRLLARRAPRPGFGLRAPIAHVAEGEARPASPAKIWKDRSLTAIGPKLKGYEEKELEALPSLDLQLWENAASRPAAGGFPCELGPRGWRILDFGVNRSGFLGLSLEVAETARLYACFDEMLLNGDVDFKRLDCVNAVAWELAPGRYTLESFEPYTLRYLKLLLTAGRCTIQDLWLREYVNPDLDRAAFAAADQGLVRLFEAGRETCRQNALDAFLDCPSRERAGWLCDSFFTARTAFLLSGGLALETVQFENYLLPERFEHLPDGMLPMCYPADHNDGVFIPNWALWFVLQLEEYAQRGGERRMVDALRPKVLRLFDYFRTFRNSDGLLEGLKGWVFVEWSAANGFVQDVNYPSNMLYAAALAAAGRLYGLADLEAEAARVRQTVVQQSYDGEFFVDNAVRRQGRLAATRNRTEVCQYAAFFFGTATPQSHPELWNRLLRDFGPRRAETKAFPEVHPANAFVGNFLRLELLSRQGHAAQILEESRSYFLFMAERTGTLWENMNTTASLNHGFASHIVQVLYRDVLGLAQVDPVGRRLVVRLNPLALEWCEGRIPVPGGEVELRWTRRGAEIECRVSGPPGYQVLLENRTGLKLRQV